MWRGRAHARAPTCPLQARSLSSEANTGNDAAFRGASVWLRLHTPRRHPTRWQTGGDVSLCIASRAIHWTRDVLSWPVEAPASRRFFLSCVAPWTGLRTVDVASLVAPSASGVSWIAVRYRLALCPLLALLCQLAAYQRLPATSSSRVLTTRVLVSHAHILLLLASRWGVRLNR